MKLFKSIATLSMALTIWSACDSDLDKVYYDDASAKPATLSTIEPAYTLDAQNSDQTAIEFTWTKPQVNYQAAITTSLEMDVKGKAFAGAVTLASTKNETTYAITTADLNAALLKVLEKYELDFGALDIEFRMASSISKAATPLYSNVASTHITPFAGEKEYPQIWIVGDYCGWNHENSQFLFSANEDDSYAGMIYFDGKSANGWKLCPEANWDAEWAADGTPAAEAPTLTLVTSGGGNMTNYAHNSYYLEFDKSTAILKVSQGYDSWGVVGEHNNWGASADKVMTLESETKFGKRQYYLTATLDLQANKGWKIRPDSKWENDKGPSQLKYDGVQEEGGNFVVAEDGNYTLKWYFNKVEQTLEVIKN